MVNGYYFYNFEHLFMVGCFLEVNVEENEVQETAQSSKKELGRKFFVFIVWMVLVAAVAVLVGIQRLSESSFDKVIDNFYIVSVVYIGGNVVQKVGRNVADAFIKKEGGEK